MAVVVAFTAALFIGAFIGILFMGMLISGKTEDNINHRNNKEHL